MCKIVFRLTIMHERAAFIHARWGSIRVKLHYSDRSSESARAHARTKKFTLFSLPLSLSNQRRKSRRLVILIVSKSKQNQQPSSAAASDPEPRTQYNTNELLYCPLSRSLALLRPFSFCLPCSSPACSRVNLLSRAQVETHSTAYPCS